MAKLQGTILASKIVPTDSLDTYATHEDEYGRGGHRSVDTIVERDEITPERRKEGMTVYVKENKTKYILEGGIDKGIMVAKILANAEALKLATAPIIGQYQKIVNTK